MKIVCIGRNYAEHARELNNEVPTEPVIFIKPDSALLRNSNPFYIPGFTKDVHYELELVVRIDRNGKSIPLQFARDYYSTMALGIDFTARDLQQNLKDKGLPWEKAKGFDYSACIGNFVNISQDQNMQDIKFEMHKNGQAVQLGHTADMIHTIDEVIAYVSQYFMLKTGDYLFTGTPAGVGPIAPGDLFEGYLEGEPNLSCAIH
jgi:2-keto-4-pentenoate hydratase/2-oxohepta-3-ene-1,7-dioic acid hydratase in catechol pathway